jgi:TRAP-type mannitol/chloroaromatic compound transport system permease small subunit
VTRLASLLDRLNRGVARIAGWGTLGMVAVTFLVVLLRYGLSIGWVWMQETVLYLHSVVFLLAAGATLGSDGHVRVDIFDRHASPRRRALIDVLGVLLFLLPFCLLVLVQSWPFVSDSWRVSESSPEPDGLPGVFLLKALIPAYALLLLVQGASLLLSRVAELIGGGPPDQPGGGADGGKLPASAGE